MVEEERFCKGARASEWISRKKMARDWRDNMHTIHSVVDVI